MAVLCEGISVIVQRATIDRAYPGGWEGFRADIPNGTLTADRVLARVGFMSPATTSRFVAPLGERGLVFRNGDSFVDIAVVDQVKGPPSPATGWRSRALPTAAETSACAG